MISISGIRSLRFCRARSIDVITSIQLSTYCIHIEDYTNSVHFRSALMQIETCSPRSLCRRSREAAARPGWAELRKVVLENKTFNTIYSLLAKRNYKYTFNSNSSLELLEPSSLVMLLNLLTSSVDFLTMECVRRHNCYSHLNMVVIFNTIQYYKLH